MHRSLIAVCALLLTQAQVPAPVGGDMSNTTVKPAGATTGRIQSAWTGDVINVKAGWNGQAGAKGDWQYIGSCSITASTTALTCVGSTFTASDVGKTIVVQKAGATGALQAQITSQTSTTQVGLSSPATNTATASRTFYGSDDTAAISAAVAYASANNKCVYIPAGGYGLVSQTTEIPVSNVCIKGDFNRADRMPYLQGSMLLVFNTATAVFKMALNNSFEGLSFFWPVQDGSVIPPIVYPAVFQGQDNTYRMSHWSMRNMMFVNPYILIETLPATVSSGAWSFSDIDSYCIKSCQHFLSGTTGSITQTNWIDSPLFYPTEAAIGTPLQAWTNANGNFLEVDTHGSTVSPNPLTTITGYFHANLQVYGLATAIKLSSGRLSAMNLTNFTVDGSRAVLTTSGDHTELRSSIWSGGYVWCQDSNALAVDTACISGNSTYVSLDADGITPIPNTPGGIDLDISNVTFAALAGDGIQDLNAKTFGVVTLNGSTFNNFPVSSTTGTHYIINLVSNAVSPVIVGNVFSCRPIADTYGIRIGSTITMLVNDNAINRCTQAFIGSPVAGSQWSLKGNISRNTTGTSSWSLTTPLQAAIVNSDSEWDKAWPSTLGTGWGTSASIACVRNWYVCKVTVGTAPSTTGNVAFPFTQAAAPVCQVTNETNATAMKVLASATGVAITGFVAGDVIDLVCAR